MIIGILKEPQHENRVSVLPEVAGQLVKMGCQVLVETTAGEKSFATNADYENAGAKTASRSDVLATDLVIGINSISNEDISGMKAGAVLVAVFQPLFL